MIQTEWFTIKESIIYFQHNPKAIHRGNMTWGHAVSKDMVHWEQLRHAILPYGNGTIFSGTAAV